MPVETVAAVLRAFGEPMGIESVTVRDPGRGEVLVRMVAAGVCHSDVGQADAEWTLPLPAVLGHEGAGVVEAVGSDVDSVEVGQRVVLSLAPGCGTCPHCLVGRPIRCQKALAAMTAGELTTGPTPIRGQDGPISTYALLGCFAKHAVVAAASVIPLPDEVPAEVAALIGCAVITGFGAAVETVGVEAGSRGAVLGFGGVGAAALQGAMVQGAAVTVVDVAPERLEQAHRLGATHTVDSNDERAVAALRRAAAEAGFDWTIVTVGAADAVRLGIEATRPGGVTAVVGLLPENSPIPVDMLDLVTYEKAIVGSAYGSITPQLLVPRIVELYLAGRLALDDLVSERFPLDEIEQAFDRSRRACGLRSVISLTNRGSF